MSTLLRLKTATKSKYQINKSQAHKIPKRSWMSFK